MTVKKNRERRWGGGIWGLVKTKLFDNVTEGVCKVGFVNCDSAHTRCTNESDNTQGRGWRRRWRRSREQERRKLCLWVC